jgi:outer membrane lipase/esterase
MFKGFGVRWALGAVGVLSACVLMACGGGEQVEKFVPTRIVSFGDENSAIVDINSDRNGAKYNVNALKDPTTTAGAVVLDCLTNPVWNEYVATSFSLVFPECNPNAVATTSRNLSALNARASGTSNSVQSQIDTFLSTDSFNDKTLVTIMAGHWDVRAQYDAVAAGTISSDTAVANVEAAGTALAEQVNRVAALGGKVLITTIPDVGTMPFGIAQDTASPGRAALLTQLTTRFNAKLRVGLTNDGTKIGLVLGDEAISANVKTPGITFTDVTRAACDPVAAPTLLQCTTSTLLKDSTGTVIASGDVWLWSDAEHLSAGGQRLIGNLAAGRAVGNPF